MPRLVKDCKQCGKSFKTKHDNKFCCRECYLACNRDNYKAPVSKLCTDCDVEKPVDQFHYFRSRWSSDRLYFEGRCKECTREKERLQRVNKIGSFAKKPMLAREYRLQTKYGLSLELYERHLQMQQGVCAICKEPPPPPGAAPFCVDHDHETGATRSILCNPCNQGLGRFKDNSELLRNAAEYIEIHEEWQKFLRSGGVLNA
jgi:recombination endonuclease VII